MGYKYHFTGANVDRNQVAVGRGTTEGADLIDSTERTDRVDHALLDMVSVVPFLMAVRFFYFTSANHPITRIKFLK
jgi:hypothetical protein